MTFLLTNDVSTCDTDFSVCHVTLSTTAVAWFNMMLTESAYHFPVSWWQRWAAALSCSCFSLWYCCTLESSVWYERACFSGTHTSPFSPDVLGPEHKKYRKQIKCVAFFPVKQFIQCARVSLSLSVSLLCLTSVLCSNCVVPALPADFVFPTCCS